MRGMDGCGEQELASLSAYLDGELSWSEQAALEAHLERCPRCASTLAELRRVVARAASLEDRPPAADLWSGIVERIDRPNGQASSDDGSGEGAEVVDIRPRLGSPKPRARRIALSLPQLAAASVGLIALSGGAVWMALRGGTDAPAPRVAMSEGAEVPTGPRLGVPSVEFSPADTHTQFAVAKYELAIADLEEVLIQGEGRLDGETLAVIRRSLAVIDRAIQEAREALEADPESAYLYAHLADTMRQKVDLLRYANHFATARS